ncbi:MAG TPA: RNA chaperone Hfq [Burkholderiales bacterium]|nr:RNA chaperone Hfq [Burkholderiales bacterium]
MAGSKERIQDALLNQYRKHGTRIRVVLLNSDAFDGTIESFDVYSIRLASSEPLLLLKTSIAMIEPAPKHGKVRAHAPRVHTTQHGTPPARTAPVIERKRRRVVLRDDS